MVRKSSQYRMLLHPTPPNEQNSVQESNEIVSPYGFMGQKNAQLLLISALSLMVLAPRSPRSPLQRRNSNRRALSQLKISHALHLSCLTNILNTPLIFFVLVS
ncbi:hypothetical protein CEXT_668311 [Caerostris extrusa]|uniref:Uncharacterized protein n=1 Tax=Caerostris extrusa TaxID=172846 RepID=A0AAV4UBB7_CAEEX|nr:hypothetical protein CEXT_668311 [Caerostris extrusa]